MDIFRGILMRWKIAHPRQSSGVRPIRVAPSSVVPSGVTDYLLPYEKQVITVRRHPGLLVAHVILLGCACVAASLLTVFTNSGALVLSAVWGTCAVILLYLIARVAQWLSAFFVVTDTRLMFITGIIARKVTTVPIREIHDLELHRSLIGRLIGYGRFIAQPSKTGDRMPRMNYMPYSEQLFLEVASLLFPDEVENSYQRDPEE
jgi:membrane protein YdbS with pleckstrin-like domain